MSIPCATCHRNVSVTSVRVCLTNHLLFLSESRLVSHFFLLGISRDDASRWVKTSCRYLSTLSGEKRSVVMMVMIDMKEYVQVHFHSYQINHLLQPTSATENRIESRTFSASRLPTDNANPFIIATNQIDASTSMLNSVVQYRMDLGQVRPAFADNTTNSGFQYQGDFMFTPIYADSIVRSTENTWLWKITHAQERISMYRKKSLTTAYHVYLADPDRSREWVSFPKRWFAVSMRFSSLITKRSSHQTNRRLGSTLLRMKTSRVIRWSSTVRPCYLSLSRVSLLSSDFSHH